MASSGTGVETKVAAGATTTVVAGYIAWALITYVPVVRDQFPADIQGQLPVMIAFALSAIVGYLAPHTHRPDLAQLPELLSQAQQALTPAQPQVSPPDQAEPVQQAAPPAQPSWKSPAVQVIQPATQATAQQPPTG